MSHMPAAARSYSQSQEIRRPALRPLALPTEHGGWGFLFEPLVLGLLVAFSGGGLLIAAAFICGFLTRQPLKFALQDALRQRSYPRTRWCWIFAASYGAGALAFLGAAAAVSGWVVLIPLGLAAPLGITQILYDANNRSRALLPELGGVVAISSSAAAIALAGGMRLIPSLALSGIIIARSIPAIAWVRTLIQRSHGKEAPGWPSIVLHFAAVAVVLAIGPPLAAVAMALLLLRAVWGLMHTVPPAKTIGWREIGWGTVTILLVATGYAIGI
jgi:hypothetical protein